jgi:hypothetical protein
VTQSSVDYHIAITAVLQRSQSTITHNALPKDASILLRSRVAYIAGRSNGFYLDYITIYDAKGVLGADCGGGDYSTITEEDRQMVENAPASLEYQSTRILPRRSMHPLKGNMNHLSTSSWTLNGRTIRTINRASLAVLNMIDNKATFGIERSDREK